MSCGARYQGAPCTVVDKHDVHETSGGTTFEHAEKDANTLLERALAFFVDLKQLEPDHPWSYAECELLGEGLDHLRQALEAQREGAATQHAVDAERADAVAYLTLIAMAPTEALAAMGITDPEERRVMRQTQNASAAAIEAGRHGGARETLDNFRKGTKS